MPETPFTYFLTDDGALVRVDYARFIAEILNRKSGRWVDAPYMFRRATGLGGDADSQKIDDALAQQIVEGRFTLIDVAGVEAMYVGRRWYCSDEALNVALRGAMSQYGFSLDRLGSVVDDDLRVADWVARHLGGRVVHRRPTPPFDPNVIH